MKFKIKTKELFFYIAFFVWLLYQLLEANIYFRQVFLDYSVYKVVYVITYVSLIISILKNTIVSTSVKKLMINFSVLFGGLIAVYMSEDVTFLLTLILFIFAARGIDFTKIISFDIKMQIVVMIFNVSLALMGIIENGVRYRGSIARYYLGYKSTLAPMFLFHITMMFIFIKKEKFKLKHAIVILIVNQFFFMKSNVRAPYIYTIVLVLLTLIGKKIKLPQRKVAINLVTLIVPILYVITIMVQALYSLSNPFLVGLDTLLSSRIRLGNDAIVRYGFSLWGNNITWNYVGVKGAVYSYVDSAYLKYTLMYGGIVMGLIVIGHALLIRNAWKHNDIYLLIILLGISVNAIADPQMLYLQYNPFILLLGMFLHPSKKQFMLPNYKSGLN